jgi:uncharacterized protein (DUF697 family)
MKPSSFLGFYDKLEKLVRRLPETLQQPILREITPIKTLFLLQRAPRIVLLGSGGTGKVELINALFGAETIQPGEENLTDGRWQDFGRSARGILRLLDARRPASLHLLKEALAAEAPDLFVFVRPARDIDEDFAADLAHASELVTYAESQHPVRPRLLGLLLADASADFERARQDLHAALHTRTELSDHMAGTLALKPGAEAERLIELIALELPGEAQLEMARLSGNRSLQKQIAQVVIKSVTAICAAVGAQPIPLADFPILTSLQASMVAGIMHISGREMSVKLGGEFLAAVGANVGLGLALREGSRAAVKLVPIWGNAISGAVAGAGAFAVGRAASAYFIEGVSMQDARGLFRRRRKEKPLLKD